MSSCNLLQCSRPHPVLREFLSLSESELAKIFEIDRIFWKIILKILEILANSDSDKKQRGSATLNTNSRFLRKHPLNLSQRITLIYKLKNIFTLLRNTIAKAFLFGVSNRSIVNICVFHNSLIVAKFIFIKIRNFRNLKHAPELALSKPSRNLIQLVKIIEQIEPQVEGRFAYCQNPDTPDLPIYPIMQHETLTCKITRSAKHSNMGGYINMKNRANPLIGVIGVQTIRHNKTSGELKFHIIKGDDHASCNKNWNIENCKHHALRASLSLSEPELPVLPEYSVNPVNSANSGSDKRQRGLAVLNLFQFKANEFKEAA